MKNIYYENVLKKAYFLFFMIFSSAILAQGNSIKGTITSSDGLPLSGVNVVQKGTSKGTVTNFDGKYEIKLVPGLKTLVFSYIGFSDKEIKVESSSTINVTLKEDAQNLNEVVVVGYGSQKRADVIGAVGSINAEDIAAMPVATFDMALQGRTAGLQITNTSSEPGGEVTIRIRGSNSVLGNNAPLIVIDGYPMPSNSEASSAGAGDGNQTSSNILSYLNPSEIASVQVLKDASATAIYGSRGANGVIMVTTKKGNYKQATKINFSTETGISDIPTLPELLDGPTYAQWKNELAATDPFDGVIRPLPENVASTNWLDRILRTGINTMYQLTVSGGDEKTRYFLSGNYTKIEGILKYTDFTRGNIRLNVDSKLSRKLNVNTSVNYARIKNNRSSEGTGAIINSGTIFQAYKNSPTAVPGDPIDQGDGTTSYFADPLVELRDTKNETFNENLILSIQTKYNISKGFDFNLTTGTTSLNSRRELYFPKTTRVGLLYNSRAVYNVTNSLDYLLESYFTYKKAFDSHNFDATAGYSWQDNVARGLNTRVEGFPVDVLETDNIGIGLVASIPTSSKIQRTLISYYFRLNYDYDKRYYLTLTGRADGSSVFAKNNKWGYFPSAAVGWNISNESFLDNFSQLSNLKLRASYGITGSQTIQPLQSLTLLGAANATFGDVLSSGLAPNRLGNPDLKWEETTQFNLGLDIGFLKDRFTANVDYYKKTTNDLLLPFPLPTSAGLTSIVANAGSIENKGLEIMVGGYIVDNKKFKWNTNFNWSNNKATVKSLGKTNADIYGPGPATNIITDPSNIMRVGQPFGALYGYEVIGVMQTSDFTGTVPNVPVLAGAVPGVWKFKDLNGDGVITPADRKIIGNPNPDYIFGWNNDFKYKNFTLSVFFQGSVGNDLMNLDRHFLASGRSENNVFKDWFDNKWTTTNPTNDPRYSNYNPQTYLQPNTAVLEDGSYVRLKNVSLGYNLNAKKMKGIASARVYVTGTNLFTLTHYSGFDPEVNIRGGNNLSQGIDFASYPRSKTFTLGIQIGL